AGTSVHLDPVSRPTRHAATAHLAGAKLQLVARLLRPPPARNVAARARFGLAGSRLFPGVWSFLCRRSDLVEAPPAASCQTRAGSHTARSDQPADDVGAALQHPGQRLRLARHTAGAIRPSAVDRLEPGAPVAEPPPSGPDRRVSRDGLWRRR